jgi:tRNA(Ile)-lysidine synthase
MREHALVERGATVLVAVSGGADSMALLHVLSLLRRERAFGLFAHGVDHTLRSEATTELDLAEEFARSLDVPFSRTRVAVARGGNLQARARALRWEALHDAAGRCGAGRIATGHHADDRAETMLMRIIRGTRAGGLAVLPPRDGDRIRPLLKARRADVDAHVRRHRIPHCHDPSNDDPRFLRVRVRLEILPALERLNPRVVEHMYALADELDVLNERRARSASNGLTSSNDAREDDLDLGVPEARPTRPTTRTRSGRSQRQSRQVRS